MILAIPTNASCVPKPNAKSHAAVYFYLTNKNKPDVKNRAILTIFFVIKHVMALASEAELTVSFYGCKLGISLCIALEEMGHCQPPTLITTDKIGGGTGSNADKHSNTSCINENVVPTTMPTTTLNIILVYITNAYNITVS